MNASKTKPEGKAVSCAARIAWHSLLIWFFALSGPFRVLIGQGSRIFTLFMTVVGVLITLGLLLKMRRVLLVRVMLYLIFANVTWMVAVSVLGGIPPWGIAAGVSILLFLPAVLSLSAGVSADKNGRAKTGVVKALLAMNLFVLGIQILLMTGVDRGTGLLGNDRASNTVALFTMLVSLGLWLQDPRQWSPAFLLFGIASALAWLGDSKASLALVFTLVAIWAAVIIVARLTHKPSRRELKKLVTASLILGMLLVLALQGILTGAPADLGPKVREGVAQLYVSTPASPHEQSASSTSSTSADIGKRVTGDGLGSGGSYLGTLAGQGTFSFLPDSEVMEDRHLEKLVNRKIETKKWGLLYSPNKTFVGVIDELGLVGLILYGALLIAGLLQFRERINAAGLVSVGFMLVAAGIVTPFLEYPEVALSVATFLLILVGGRGHVYAPQRDDEVLQ